MGGASLPPSARPPAAISSASSRQVRNHSVFFVTILCSNWRMRHSSFDRPARICAYAPKKSQKGQARHGSRSFQQGAKAFFSKDFQLFFRFRPTGARRSGGAGFLCSAACAIHKFPTFSTWFSTQKALFLAEKGFVCGKSVGRLPLHINFSTYGPIVDFQASFKEKMWKT